MKSQIERILRESLEFAEDTMKWTSEAMPRLRPGLMSKGDPAKLQRHQRYYDEAFETAEQIREYLAPTQGGEKASKP